MYQVNTTNRFNKDLKKCKKRGYDINLLNSVIKKLVKDGKLPKKYKPHKLSGNYKNCWECHIKSDWLLVWQQNDCDLVLILMNTGTHSDLF